MISLSFSREPAARSRSARPVSLAHAPLLFALGVLLPCSANSSVTLAWNPAAGARIAGFRLYWGGASGAYTNLDDVGNSTNASLSSLSPGVTYYFAVTSYTSAGLESAFSSEISFTVPATNGPPPPSGLPAPWQTSNIGTVGVTGSASGANGLYSVAGAGTLSGTADSFRFVYQPLTADGEIRARINSVQAASSGARVGVMIRETLAAGSRFAFMGLAPDGTFRWQRRGNTSGNTSSTASGAGLPPNAWARVVRAGNTLSGYESTNGVDWKLVRSSTVNMVPNILIGLAVASGDPNSLNLSTFTNVTVAP